MFSSLFPIPIPPFYCRQKTSNIMAIWLGILLLLVPFFVIMMLENRRRVDHDEEDEEVGFIGFDENLGEEYLGEEEEGSGDVGTKTKPNQIPLWKYVSRPGGEKGGGTTKFTCLHCKNTYTSPYTRAKRHLCGKRPWDGDKQIGIKACVIVSATQRAK